MSEQNPGDDPDKTLIRPEGEQKADGSKSDKKNNKAPAAPDDSTLIRGEEPRGSNEDQKDAAAGASDETLVRDEKVRDEKLAADDATLIRGDVNGSDGDATVIRGESGPEIGHDEATILRGPGQPESTVLRDTGAGGGASNDSATILREPADGQATILRSGAEMRSAPDAATILRDGDDDATVINSPGIHSPDGDATVLSGGNDTTVFANAPEGSGTNRGNSEAGRLLKNRFVLEEKVGSGGMGDVYKALDLRQQEAQERNPYIAIKILNESFARHKDAFISLQRETTRTRGIPHPNIMAVYDFDKEGDTVFMSMELLDGKPLDDYLKEHSEGVSTEDAWNIIDGICQGLGRAHGAGIVHSDFKPGNIYYTKNKTAKVFDFGIARAVTNPNELEAEGEKTVFDAGSLGALTPTYASYEMLKGLEPTKSDDVYAVALVAYELFTGKHPYNRVPADKALERGIEPEPPANLKRRHWRALRKALEIKGEKRTQTIDEFYEGMFSEDPPYFRYAAIAAVLVASVGFGVYQQFFRAAEEVPEGFTQYMTSYTSAMGNINSRLDINNRDFSSTAWHNGIETGLNEMALFNISMQEEFSEYLDEGWESTAETQIDAMRTSVMDAYLEGIADLRSRAEAEVVDTSDRAQVEAAIATLGEAHELLKLLKDKYNFDAAKVSSGEVQLGRLSERRNVQLETITQNEIAAAAAAAAEQKAKEERDLAEARRQQRNTDYLAKLEDFRRILRCKGDIENPDIYGDKGLQGVISDLRRIYPEQFAVDKPGIVSALAGCIEQRVAIRAPERARTIKAAVTSYLPGEARLAEIEILDLDPCAERRLVGQGNRNRQWCEDQLAVGGTGPELVVIPRRRGALESEPLGLNYAMTRVEVRVGDYNQYCEDAGCSKLTGASALPATNVSLEQAQAYAAWLSDQSGKTYRIPTADEWYHAATTNGTAKVDENVNCTVDSRGVRLGERLLNTLSGKPNGWGLYNYVGNAREWAVSGEDLVALGGAHTDPKAECTLSKSVVHSGQADPVTGFRLYREIESAETPIETNSAD